MMKISKELLLALLIYVVTMTVLLMVVYRFLENWHLSQFNFFIAGALVLLVAVGWGYILTALIFVPKKYMEDTLTTIINEIVHELNIPLSTIHANTTMLKKSLQDEKSLKRLARIDDASKRLTRLYDELLYTLRKEIHTIEKESFDIKEIVGERVAFFQEQARNPFELAVEPYVIKADKIGFEQMIDNIISNAMKYSAKESLISLLLDKDTLCIKDKGVGMSTSELLRVHERYFKSDDKSKGEGIGLTLVKTYCDNENIPIEIKSEKNIGTSVCLHLVKVHGSKYKYSLLLDD